MWYLIAIVMVGFLCACSATAAPAPTPSTRQLTEADAGRSIELRAGDKLEVTLPGNPTTGFQWDVSVGDTAILRPSGEPEFAPSSSAVGGGGTITLRFAAVGTGQMGLTLIYHRPFEKDVPPAQTFEVTVTVR
jgi:inhibitor of cysteine peptidase